MLLGRLQPGILSHTSRRKRPCAVRSDFHPSHQLPAITQLHDLPSITSLSRARRSRPIAGRSQLVDDAEDHKRRVKRPVDHLGRSGDGSEPSLDLLEVAAGEGNAVILLNNSLAKKGAINSRAANADRWCSSTNSDCP
jgi:hypothetical protein